MAIQSQSAARARSDAVVGALTVTAIAIFVAGLFTFLQGATTSIALQNAPANPPAGYPPVGTEQNLERMTGDLQGKRAEGERLGGNVSELDWLAQQIAAANKRLADAEDLQKALIEIRAAERTGQ